MGELATRVLTGTIAGVLFFGSYFISRFLFAGFLLVGLLYILFLEWPKLISWRKLLFWLVTPLYPIAPFAWLIVLSIYGTTFQCMYPFIVAWGCDTTSYIFGVLWGKHKICPRISPKKSWEGLFGGFLGVFLLHVGLFRGLGLVALIILSFVMTLTAFFGDIFVSFLKRKKGMKDVGALLPGHGGLLDRFDSVLFVSLCYFLFFVVTKYIFTKYLWL